ncbi:hypothetical protein LshimejAT787_0605040 [Lyophyllum shimeji]|uniref:Uncharacterized protein n=1 Tax=Lyophyllum shimeji TaxID=47721 RepID=A0A9P3UNH7_LYOSH|nr:hypothetical protein LshimejAT787_0605040 [Lyophyllum shimeji]
MCEKLTELVVECINKALPIIGPHSSPLIHHLVIRCHEIENNTGILGTLKQLLAFSTENKEAIVAAFRHLLSLRPPPTLHRSSDWVSAGPAFAEALREAGLAPWLLAIVTLEDEADDRYFYRRQALTTLAALVEHTPDKADRRDLGKLFLDSDKAVEAAIDLAGDSYYAEEVKGALASLAKDYSEGATRLEKEGLSVAAVTKTAEVAVEGPALFHHEEPVEMKKKRSRWCFWM